MLNKKLLFAAILLFLFVIIVINHSRNTVNLPLVAIANYGSHSSLDASIRGMKIELARLGFVEHKTIEYVTSDVGFDLALISQMITKLKNARPKVMVVISTPVAQFAKHAIKDIPLVFNAITDPIAAGLLKKATMADINMTGASDKQNLDVLLSFAKQIIPNATKVGILYATAEANDYALVKILEKAAKASNMQVLAVPIDTTRDIPIRMQQFAKQVDFIYVGTSGTIQPALPTIIAAANKMKIPVFNVEPFAAREQQVLASFGVDYHKVGVNAGKIVARLLKGEPITSIQSYYPALNDHQGFISKQRLKDFGLQLPIDLTNITVVE